MPIHMRRFYLRKLTSVKEQEASQHEAANKVGDVGNSKGTPKIDRPQFAARK